ncbi:hypothetical protein K3Z99_24655, partial [Pseudomonas aeruginosa]|nr:hypothetical protein [Pseudomonas aeruginosa]
MRRLRPARRAFQALLALVFCCLPHVGEAAQLVLVSANQGAAVNAFRDALSQRRPQDQVELRTPLAQSLAVPLAPAFGSPGEPRPSATNRMAAPSPVPTCASTRGGWAAIPSPQRSSYPEV